MTRKLAATAPATKVTEAPAPQPNLCKCGCGQATTRPEARYVSGHDARHAGEVGRSSRSDDEVRELFADAPKLQAKALRVRETARRKEAEKVAASAAREAAKAAAKVAYEAALAAK